jgi:cellulose synthase/poly-beta-1,6-N-acetylglucosamine synthase-like glycosyltransferase
MSDLSLLPQISVIIPIYNGEADLPDLLNCLWAQTYAPDRVEYLIVDNNSHDRTLHELQAAQTEAQQRGVTLQVLSENQIQSSYAARNQGIRGAQGTIVAFTDADCRPAPDWLAQLVQPFTDPAVGVVAGEVQALPGKSLLEHHADRQATLSQTHTLAHPFCPYGQTANLAVRRQIFEQVGLFRPYLTTGGDADLCWRILRHTPWQMVFAETAIVRHRHRATLAELRHQWQRYGCSNRYLHELHGVELMRSPTLSDYVYRLARWLGKEFPIATFNLLRGEAQGVDLLQTPIGLICAHARAAGQAQAQLPAAAKEIVWMESLPPSLC